MSDINECENPQMCSSSSPPGDQILGLSPENQTLRCVNTYGSYICAPVNELPIKMIVIGMSFYS